jgi:hypothetical protein
MTIEEFVRRAQAAQAAVDGLTRPAPDRSTAHVVDLQRHLRVFLLETMPFEAPDSIASALMYELVSITAAMADTEEQARALLGDWLANAEAQIKTFGVGRPHP